MKGLLLKDFALIKNMKTYAFFILALSLIMLLNGHDTTFITSYTTMLCVIIGTNTLHYDAFDNGYAFLFTLPVTRKLYVQEKYVFSLISAAVGIAFSMVTMVIAEVLSDSPVLTSDNMSFVVGIGAAGMIMLGILLPVELKYGPEKSRVALIVVAAVVMACIYLTISGPFDFSGIISTLSQIKPIMLVGIGILIAIGFMAISYRISCRIVEKKEF